MFGSSNTNNGNMRDVNMRDTHMRDTNMRDVHHNNKFNNRRYRTTITGNINIFNINIFKVPNHNAMNNNNNGNELAALYQEPLVSSDGDAEFVNSVDAESDGLLNILHRSSSPLPPRRLPLFVLEEIEREEKKNVIDVPCKKCGDPMQKFENSWKVYQNHFGWICDGCEKDKNSVEEIYHCECIKDGYDLCQECVNTMDINENKKIIDEPDSDSDSDYNDPDESPSSKRKVSDLSNLYRDNSDNTWSSEDIEDLHNAMNNNNNGNDGDNELADLYQDTAEPMESLAEIVNSIDAESDGLLNILYRSSSPLPPRRRPLFVLEDVEREEKEKEQKSMAKKTRKRKRCDLHEKEPPNKKRRVDMDYADLGKIYYCDCKDCGSALCDQCAAAIMMNKSKIIAIK